jgi:thymidylate synthase (FAD)
MPAALKVTLLQSTPEPDRAVAAAGRLCYAPVSAADLSQEMSEEDVARMVRILVGSGHHSALEHATFTFAVDGISRACSHQLVRHRLASYNQQSQRYVLFGEEDDFVLPPNIDAVPEARAVFVEAMAQARDAYQKLVEIGLARGYGKETVQEDARFVLPNAAETKIVVTMNARELRHFYRVRCCRRAQWEINRLAWTMRRLALGRAPLLFEDSGPGCLTDGCPEGKMTCGSPYTEEEIVSMDVAFEGSPAATGSPVAAERHATVDSPAAAGDSTAAGDSAAVPSH